MKKVSFGLAIVFIMLILVSGLAVAQTASPTPVTGIRLNMGLMDLTVGQSDFLRVTVSPAGATQPILEWAPSSNPNVATVHVVSANTARITAIAPGTAIITVRTEDGLFSDAATITVRPASPTATPRTGGATVMATLIASGLIGAGAVAIKKIKR